MSTNDFSTAIAESGFAFDGPHLVAASAGTGKTYSIQNIYARLVAEEGLRVSEIQVMTFTEAATKELRDRIRKMLSLLRAHLAGETVDEKEVERLETLRSCIEGRGVSASAARARLEMALMEFDCAAISTIHGFCRRALARYAFETGAPFDVELTETDDAVLDRMARDWWRTARTNAPEALRDELDLGRMSAYVTKLAARPDAEVECDPATPAGYMLAEAKKIADAYHAARRARQTRTFDELLLSLRDALRSDVSGALARHLREEFKAVVVDEFQDTDPVQYEIFRRAFLDVPAGVQKPSLFFVGDPKQAIYSFRGGDIFTYRSAALREDVAARTFRLEKNFRSTPRLIDAVNLLFRDFKTDTGNVVYTFGDEAIGYPKDLAADMTKPALQTRGRDDPQPFRVVRVRNHRSKAEPEGLSVAEGVSEVTVEAVLDVLHEQKGVVSPKDIAILVSSHGKGRGFHAALSARGVPSVLQHAGNVFGQSIASDFRTVLQAMALQGGVGRVRAAMMTAFFDFTPAELDADSENETLAGVVALFKELNDVWRTRGFDAAMAALENYGRCDFRRRFAALPDGERKLADVLQLIDLSIATVRAQGPSPDALIAWVTDRINNSGGESSDGPEGHSEEFARELESEHDAVKIMTMHVSKGLEFPVVIVPLPAREAASTDPGPYGFHDEDGTTFRYSPDRTGKHEKEAEEERIRLLYVALTRATKRTVVVVPETVPGSWPIEALLSNARRNAGEKDGEGPIAVVDDYLPREMPDYVPPRPELGSEKPIVARAEFDQTPSKGSYSSLSPKDEADHDGIDRDAVPARPLSQDEDRPAVFKLSGGKNIGTCWHKMLEQIDFAVDDQGLDRAVRTALSLYGLPENDAPTVADMMRKTLDVALTAPDGGVFSLRDVAAADRFSEWEFDFSSRDAARTTASLKAVIERHWADDPSKAPFLKAMAGWNRPIPRGFLRGFVDLLFRHGDYCYVVDWKSNIINGAASGFTTDGIAGEMAEHGYFFQYLLYATVLHRFLRETMGAEYSWERNFGGVRYYFLRGVAAGCPAAVFADRPSAAMLDELAAELGMEDRT